MQQRRVNCISQLVLLVLLLVVVMEVLVNSVNLGERCALVPRVQVLQLVMANALKRTMWSVHHPPCLQCNKTQETLKSALREITSLLNTVVRRVEKVECELKQQRSTPSSSSDSTPSTSKKQMFPLLLGYVDINQAIMCVHVRTFPYYRTQTLLGNREWGWQHLINTLSIQVTGFKYVSLMVFIMASVNVNHISVHWVNISELRKSILICCIV